MSFFKDLSSITKGMALTMRIQEKNGTLTISMLPDAINQVQPLIITGTPEWLDKNFMDKVTVPMREVSDVVNAESFSKSVQATANKKGTKGANAKPAKEKMEDEDTEDIAKPKDKAKNKQSAPAKPETKKAAPIAPPVPEGPKQLSII